MMNLPRKSVIREMPLDPDPENPDYIVLDVPKKPIERPIIIPMPILSHFTEKGGDLTEEIKLQLIDFVMQIIFEPLSKALREPLNKAPLHNLDVRVEMLQSDKSTLIQDDINNKNIYKVIVNLHEKAQSIQFHNLEALMENQSVRLEQGESCSYWPTPIQENYCIDNFHDRRYIGTGSLLDITLFIKDSCTLTIGSLITTDPFALLTLGVPQRLARLREVLVRVGSDIMEKSEPTERNKYLKNGPVFI